MVGLDLLVDAGVPILSALLLGQDLFPPADHAKGVPPKIRLPGSLCSIFEGPNHESVVGLEVRARLVGQRLTTRMGRQRQ